jgi:serine/threonine protein kinase
MLALLARFQNLTPLCHKNGYTNAVDYWSLGVTIFVLLTGALPFHHDNVIGFLQYIDNCGDSGPPDYARFYEKISKRVASRLMSEDCMSILTGLLCIDEKKRLGTGNDGQQRLKTHPWFANIAWNLLAQKLVQPPLSDKFDGCESSFFAGIENAPVMYHCFSDMLVDLAPRGLQGKQLGAFPPNEYHQAYFSSWYVLVCVLVVSLWCVVCVAFTMFSFSASIGTLLLQQP